MKAHRFSDRVPSGASRPPLCHGACPLVFCVVSCLCPFPERTLRGDRQRVSHLSGMSRGPGPRARTKQSPAHHPGAPPCGCPGRYNISETHISLSNFLLCFLQSIASLWGFCKCLGNLKITIGCIERVGKTLAGAWAASWGPLSPWTDSPVQGGGGVCPAPGQGRGSHEGNPQV